MVVGHRWKYSYYMRQYYCDSLPFGGVESHQWCMGCGVIVTNKELYESNCPRPERYSDNYFSGIYLDILARGKGFVPIEAGTYAAWLLKRKKVAEAA